MFWLNRNKNKNNIIKILEETKSIYENPYEEINEMIKSIDSVDSYILDKENAIVVIDNKEDNDNRYTTIHYRLIDKQLVEINRWSTKVHYFGYVHYITVIKNLNLFQVQNKLGDFDALYDYKQDEFIVKPGLWDSIESGTCNKNIDKYNGFLASFEIKSDIEKDDTYSYINPVTNEKITETFMVKDGKYYAIINLDGTIRRNRLFKGEDFSKIIEIINLDNYESLEEFKNVKKHQCNEQKQKLKLEYKEKIKLRNDGSISPYLDNEVAKVLKINI